MAILKSIWKHLILSPIFKDEKSSLILVDNDNSVLIKRAGRNLPWLNCLSYNRLSAHTLYYSENIAITEDAVNELNNFFGKESTKSKTVLNKETK